MRTRGIYRDFDKALFATPLAIFFVGLASIYSASFETGQALDQSLALRQLFWMIAAVAAFFWIVRRDYRSLQDWAMPLYLASLVFLVIVLFMPARLGAHRWIRIGPMNFQPSEMAKFATMLVLARFFASKRWEYASASERAFPFLVTAVPFLLILKEPDLGTALLFVPVLVSMLWLWGMPLRHLAMLAGAGAVASPILFFFLKEYQRARLLVFVNPNADPLGAGYTIAQSKIAIGSGGFFGRGFLGGTQNQLNFLPERHTDFIFGVIGEEGGFIAGSLLILGFMLIVQKGISICQQTSDRFGAFLACGITTLIGVQTIVNLGMTMGMLPVVGIPLPLVSYGGTSIVVTMLLIGVLVNVKMRRPLF